MAHSICNIRGFSKQILEMFFPHVYSFFLTSSFLFNPGGDLPFTQFICHAVRDCLSTEFLTVLIWPWMYSICSFWYVLISSFCAFLSFWALALVGFLLLHRDAVFSFPRLMSPRELYVWLLVWLVCILLLLPYEHWRSSHLSFRVNVLDIFWWVSNLFLNIIVYLLLISLLLSKDQSKCVVWLFATYSCVGSDISLLRQFGGWKTHLQKRNMPHNSKRY